MGAGVAEGVGAGDDVGAAGTGVVPDTEDDAGAADPDADLTGPVSDATDIVSAYANC